MLQIIIHSKYVEREAGNVASKVTCEMQQQARDARLQPLIKSVGVKGAFPKTRKDFVLRDATILYCTLRKSVSIFGIVSHKEERSMPRQ